MEFLTTKGILSSIEKIIRDANEFIIIVSPFLQIGQAYIERLVEAEKKKIRISIVYKNLDDSEKDKLFKFHNSSVFQLDKLHAKCYMNEKTALITSMNFYKFSEENREVGIEITRNENKYIYESIKKEMDSIIGSAQRNENNRTYQQNESNNRNVRDTRAFTKRNNESRGTCIRCGRLIPFNPDRPFCWDCFQCWDEYGNEDYPENFCHRCGTRSRSVCYARPLCPSCYRGSQNFYDRFDDGFDGYYDEWDPF